MLVMNSNIVNIPELSLVQLFFITVCRNYYNARLGWYVYQLRKRISDIKSDNKDDKYD